MQVEYSRATCVAIWGLTVCACGVAANITSVSSWVLLGCAALLPPIAASQFWSDRHSMSESIKHTVR